MTHTALETIIEAAFEDRANINAGTQGDIRKAVVESLSNPSEDIARHVLAMAGANPDRIETTP